ncbi:MAG: winged helix-turn-helix transcriptional regulator [Chloroflexi bacterium]|nr:winged helix-turn-helix transcriptional regulator [Chloroflexota bacterium]
MDRLLLQRHAELCQTLASPVRLEILGLLRDGEQRVGELAAQTGLNQSNISQHLTVLRHKGIVATRREGTNVFYCIANPKIIQACDLIREVLAEQASQHAQLARAARHTPLRRKTA